MDLEHVLRLLGELRLSIAEKAIVADPALRQYHENRVEGVKAAEKMLKRVFGEATPPCGFCGRVECWTDSPCGERIPNA